MLKINVYHAAAHSVVVLWFCFKIDQLVGKMGKGQQDVMLIQYT